MVSLLNWINSTGSIVREETAFLHRRDLCAVGGWKDHGIAWIEYLIERIFIYFHQSFIQRRLLERFRHQLLGQAISGRQHSTSAAASYSKQLFLFEGLALRVIARICLTAVVVLLMLIPMLVMQVMTSATMQMLCIMLMSILFTVIISGPFNARTAEIFGPSASYGVACRSHLTLC